MLPANALGRVLPADMGGGTLGPHPEYVFVAGFNRFIQGDPSHDPDARGSIGSTCSRA